VGIKKIIDAAYYSIRKNLAASSMMMLDLTYV